MLRRFGGIYSACPSKRDILSASYWRHFTKNWPVQSISEKKGRPCRPRSGYGRNLRERARLVTVSSNDVLYKSNARYHREAQIKSKKASFAQESFVYSLKYKSMTLYNSSGVKGYDQVLVQGLIAMIVK